MLTEIVVASLKRGRYAAANAAARAISFPVGTRSTA
jgi:hypothetical protein